MNFNKIQKYRAEKAAIEQNHPYINHHIKQKEASFTEKIKVPQDKTLNNTEKQLKSISNQQTNSYIHSKSITLRDYLYITSKSLKKQTPANRTVQSTTRLRNESKDRTTIVDNVNVVSNKPKYQTSNQDIFKLVKTDINADINKILQKVQLIKISFGNSLQNTRINNEQMMQLYKIRKILKENILKQLGNVEQFITKGHSLNKRANSQLYVPDSSRELDKINELQNNARGDILEQDFKLRNKSSTFSFKN